MKLTRILVLLLGMALAGSMTADARQIGGLLKKAKKKAQDTLEQQAQKELDAQAEKLVAAMWEQASANYSDMLMNAMPKAKTTIDLENGVVHREGKEDIKLTSNATGPADADYVSFLQVSTVSLPGQLSQLAERFGNGFVETVMLHGDQKLSDEESTGTVTDLAAERFVYLNHENGEYWLQAFGDMFDMASEAMSSSETGGISGESPPGQADAPDEPSSELEANVSVKKGKKEKIRGIDTQEHIVVVETVSRSADTGEAQGKFYVVMDIWTAEEFGGSGTLKSFDERLGEAMLKEMAKSDLNGKLNFSAFGDPRMEEGMSKAQEQFGEIQGVPVETRAYFVTGPLDEELDLEAVFDEKAEADVSAFAGVESEEPVKVQTTMFKTTTFISNLSTGPFDSANLGTRGYAQIDPPYIEVQVPDDG